MGSFKTYGFYTAILLLLVLDSNNLAAQPLSLDSCYAHALKNYPLINQYELIEKTKEYTLSNASKAYLPQVSVTGIAGYIIGGFPLGGENSDDFKLIGLAQLNQTIWDGGATKAQKEIIAATAESEKASLEVSLFELRERVNQLYFGILMIDEQLVQIDQQDKVLENNAKRIKELNESGLAFKTDLQEIQVEQLKLKQQKTEFTYTRNGYLQMLALFTGLDVDHTTQFERPTQSDLPPDLPMIRPELSMFQSQRNLAEAQAKMQRVSLMPKIGVLGAGVFLYPEIGLGESSMSSLGVIGLSTSWSISGLYKNSNEKNLSQLTLNKINVQEQTFRVNNDLQTTQTRASIEKQKAVLAEDDEIVKLRTSIREGYQLKYDNGMCSMLDLLDATEKESQAASQKSLHEMQLLMSIYEYKTQTGNK